MSGRTARQATRLVRLYPRSWRKEFPDFEDVLADELDGSSRGILRNVLGAAAVEWLREFGVVPKRPADGPRSGLGLIYAALVPFAGLAMAMWSQLHSGLGAHPGPESPVLQASSLLLSVGSVAALASLPIAAVLLMLDSRRLRRTRGTGHRAFLRQLVRPTLVLLGSIGVLSTVGRGADHSGWYSPAAAALPQRGLGHVTTLWVRGIVASITPAWIHPTMFTHLPTGELVACLIAPVATFVAAGALFRVITRLPVRGPRRGSVVLAVSVIGVMLASVAACGRWLLVHPGREGATAVQTRGDQLAPGHAGWAVLMLLAVLAVVAVVGLRRVLGSQLERPTRRGEGGSLLTESEGQAACATTPLLRIAR